MTTQREHSLDLLRAIAIMSVLLLHSNEVTTQMPDILRNIFSYGWAGVELFFVLSGYLIGRQVLLESSHHSIYSIKTFWIKRWFRTFPLYFIVLFVYVVIKPLITGKYFQPNILPFLFFFQNFFSLTDFIQSWSICIEEQFYIILPIISFLLCRQISKKISFWVLFVIAAIIVRSIIYASLNIQILDPSTADYYFRFPIYTHFDGLVMGLILAASHKKWSNFSQTAQRSYLLLGIIVLSMAFYFFGPTFNSKNIIFYFSILPLSFSFILIGLQKIVLPQYILKVVQWIAILSYGSYLWNNLLIRLMSRHLDNFSWPVSLILFLISTHLISWITYLLIEQPFMNLRSIVLKQLSKQ